MDKYLVMLKGPEFRAEIERKFEKVGNSLSMPDILIVQTSQHKSAIWRCEGVVSVESDKEGAALDWALPWIQNDEGKPYSNVNTGKGVDIIVPDTGPRDTHEDLEGRVKHLWSFDDVPYAITGVQPPTHGTSVSGCAAGTTYGTAKEATIVSCRIDWWSSNILKALDKILRYHLDKPDNRPSIVNFSGTTPSAIVGKAFERLVQYGIVVIAASGNDGLSESSYPAKMGQVVSVGAVNSHNEIAAFSNRNFDIAAPGQAVNTISVFSDTGTTTISGTSFACPYYAGLMACVLQGSDKFNTSKQVNDFNQAAINILGEKGRFKPAPINGNKIFRTVTAKPWGSVFYTNPLNDISDEDIGAWLVDNVANPQLVADVCRQYNLSLARIDRIAGDAYTIADINRYFSDAGVQPWWFTG
jgi:subtilisin family serine protease